MTVDEQFTSQTKAKNRHNSYHLINTSYNSADELWPNPVMKRWRVPYADK